MSITNGYCTLAEMRARLNITSGSDTRDDADLEVAVESASRAIDMVCDRRFYLDSGATARTYRVPPRGVRQGVDVLLVDDMVTSPAPIVKVDTSDAGTFSTTLVAGTDYQLEPLNETAVYPATVKNMLRFLSLTVVPLFSGRPPVQVTAKWGWTAVPTPIKQACMIVALDLFKSKDAPFGVAGSSEFGTLRIRSDIAAHAGMLISRYRHDVHGLA